MPVRLELAQLSFKGIDPVAYASKVLTPTQQNYSQVEKELLVVTFGCSKFDEYVVGLDMTVESDHNALEAILKKPLYMAPLRLQRMLLQLQHYPGITVIYKKGETVHFADTLSRAYLNETIINTELLDINLVEEVISDVQLERFATATKGDEVLSILQKVIVEGWPETRNQAPARVREYWNFRDELSVAKGLVLKGTKIVVPKVLRSEMLERIH